MKLLLQVAAPLALAFSAATACTEPVAAQTAATPPVAAATTQAISPTPAVLSVSLPPGARLRLDIDARDQELLGVVKSLLDGFDAGGANLQAIIPQPASPTGATPAAASRDLDSAAVLQLLSDAGLHKLLGDITHLRAVVFETPRLPRKATRSALNTPGSAPSVIAYYEQAYLITEGGHRIVRADFDDVQVLTVGFPNKGFALVLQAPGLGVVVRSDGYPNLESVGPLAMAMFLRFAPKAP